MVNAITHWNFAVFGEFAGLCPGFGHGRQIGGEEVGPPAAVAGAVAD